MKTIHTIELYGAPASRKTTVAHLVTGGLLAAEKSAVYVPEYATELIRAGRHDILCDQGLVTLEQIRRISAACEHAEFVVTDSPPLLGLLYRAPSYPGQIDEVIRELDAGFDFEPSIQRHRYLLRPRSYVKDTGRLAHTDEQIQELHVKVLKLCVEFDLMFGKGADSNNIANDILKDVLK